MNSSYDMIQQTLNKGTVQDYVYFKMQWNTNSKFLPKAVMCKMTDVPYECGRIMVSSLCYL